MDVLAVRKGIAGLWGDLGSHPQDDKDAFYVADLGDILKKHLRWLKALPRVTPFYAVKCNDSKAIIRTLASIGTGFDCASKVKGGKWHPQVSGGPPPGGDGQFPG